jgi:hypothetical protein
VRDLLTAFPRLGPTGANIFCREAQLVWPELRPALDRKVLDGARRLGLPTTAKELAALSPTTGSPSRPPRSSAWRWTRTSPDQVRTQA